MGDVHSFSTGGGSIILLLTCLGHVTPSVLGPYVGHKGCTDACVCPAISGFLTYPVFRFAFASLERSPNITFNFFFFSLSSPEPRVSHVGTIGNFCSPTTINFPLSS